MQRGKNEYFWPDISVIFLPKKGAKIQQGLKWVCIKKLIFATVEAVLTMLSPECEASLLPDGRCLKSMGHVTYTSKQRCKHDCTPEPFLKLTLSSANVDM
jgi:hypothetical protein